MQKEILLNIKGMNCAACSASVEGALSKVDGVVLSLIHICGICALQGRNGKIDRKKILT